MKKNNLKSKMTMQVHDELVFDVKKNELELFQSNIKPLMENVIDMKIPLSVDFGHGSNWLEAH